MITGQKHSSEKKKKKKKYIYTYIHTHMYIPFIYMCLLCFSAAPNETS